MSSNLSLESTVVRRDDLPSTDLDGEVGLMNMDTGKYFGLDPIGSRIWNLMEKPVAVSGLIEALLEEYDVDQTSCGKQVLDFLDKLLGNGLIKLV